MAEIRRTPEFPPTDGSILFSEAADFHAEKHASLPAFVYVDEEKSDDIEEISYLEFARACHRVAHIYRPSHRGPDGQVVAILALSDTIVYQALTVGLHKAGLVVCHAQYCIIAGKQTQDKFIAIPHLTTKLSCRRRQPPAKDLMPSTHSYPSNSQISSRRYPRRAIQTITRLRARDQRGANCTRHLSQVGPRNCRRRFPSISSVQTTPQTHRNRHLSSFVG